MKILMLADVFFPDTVGGAGRVVYHLGLELCRKGHEVHILTRNTGGILPHYQQLNSNLSVHRFYTPQKEASSLFRDNKQLLYSQAIISPDKVRYCLYSSEYGGDRASVVRML